MPDFWCAFCIPRCKKIWRHRLHTINALNRTKPATKPVIISYLEPSKNFVSFRATSINANSSLKWGILRSRQGYVGHVGGSIQVLWTPGEFSLRSRSRSPTDSAESIMSSIKELETALFHAHVSRYVDMSGFVGMWIGKLMGVRVAGTQLVELIIPGPPDMESTDERHIDILLDCVVRRRGIHELSATGCALADAVLSSYGDARECALRKTPKDRFHAGYHRFRNSECEPRCSKRALLNQTFLFGLTAYKAWTYSREQMVVPVARTLYRDVDAMPKYAGMAIVNVMGFRLVLNLRQHSSETGRASIYESYEMTPSPSPRATEFPHKRHTRALENGLPRFIGQSDSDWTLNHAADSCFDLARVKSKEGDAELGVKISTPNVKGVRPREQRRQRPRVSLNLELLAATATTSQVELEGCSPSASPSRPETKDF
ncbi:hypothetical protein AG1IA_05722 [Rhizoctonia solani AG-1 IA]|uniref:Uncharacterized protein n=1 Tax=Thanatephorus cucumeris (strain AG1-IA) TaxID=983506 RepID=L8WTZ7_THACA|nr:hypothetical protein AG1IA_05722 [Rhizoctonia solani AG-1 IA]